MNPHPPKPLWRSAAFWIVVSSVWLAGCMVAVRASWVRDEAHSWGVAFQCLAGIPVAGWACVLWNGMRPQYGPQFGGPQFGRNEAALLFLGALAARLVLLGAAPALSDDVYRYLWEGRVQRAGMNPFALAPEAPELAELRDGDWELINHPEYTAIYPPLAQASFLVAALIHPTIPTVKAIFIACDLLVLLVLLRWLARLGRSPAWAAIWAFHPLVVVEFAGSGHVDALMVLMVVLSLWLLEEKREVGAILALAGAVAAKLIPLLLLPYFVWKLRRKWLVLLIPALVAASYLPYAGAGSGLFRSLWIYQRDWLYNAPLFDFARDTLFATNGFLARYWFYGALAAIGGVLWIRKAPPAAALLPVLGFYQIAGPVVHPWYLCVFLPLVCVRRGAWPWVWLTLAVPLAYAGEANPLVRGAIWIPFFGGLAVQSVWALRKGIAFAGEKEEPAIEAVTESGEMALDESEGTAD